MPSRNCPGRSFEEFLPVIWSPLIAYWPSSKDWDTDHDCMVPTQFQTFSEFWDSFDHQIGWMEHLYTFIGNKHDEWGKPMVSCRFSVIFWGTRHCISSQGPENKALQARCRESRAAMATFLRFYWQLWNTLSQAIHSREPPVNWRRPC